MICPTCGQTRPSDASRYADMVHNARDTLNVAWGASDERLKLHKTVEAVDWLRRALEELEDDEDE